MSSLARAGVYVIAVRFKAESLIYQQRRASPYELERTSDSKP